MNSRTHPIRGTTKIIKFGGMDFKVIKLRIYHPQHENLIGGQKITEMANLIGLPKKGKIAGIKFLNIVVQTTYLTGSKKNNKQINIKRITQWRPF